MHQTEPRPAKEAANHVVRAWHQATKSWPGIAAPALDVVDVADIADWDILFNAVKARLRLCVGDPTGSSEGAAVREHVLECVMAMEQLQRARLLDRDRVERLEQELIDVRLALAHARTELSGAQDGAR